MNPNQAHEIITHWNQKAEIRFGGGTWLIGQALEYINHNITVRDLKKAIDNFADARKIKDTLAYKYNLPKFLRRLQNTGASFGYLPGVYQREDYCEGKVLYKLNQDERKEREKRNREKKRQEFIAEYEPIFSSWDDEKLQLHTESLSSPPKFRWLARKILEERKQQKRVAP